MLEATGINHSNKTMAKRKRVKKINRKNKNNNGKLFIILIIILLSLITITYPFKKTTPQIEVDSQIEINDTVLYPESSKKVVTENGGIISINYQTQAGVSYQSVISFYVSELPKLGWKLTSKSDVDVYFEKGDRKLRIWILYVTNSQDTGVDYIVDYQEGKPAPLQTY